MFSTTSTRLTGVALVSLLLAACTDFSPLAPDVRADSVYTVQAQGQSAVVRALTRASVCPAIAWDGGAALPMQQRAAAAVAPLRAGGAQSDGKEAVFNVLTCEAAWPAGVLRARVAGVEVPAPRQEIRRIVIIADTGCRMKGSENAFQACNDAEKWPFAQVAASAAAKKPDLVLHIGDVHYRESPCPADNAGCANSPWGYGYDAWQADLFKPAAPLLAAAPWVFVRGNHESCARAGQGWFRFIDSQPWSEARSCNDPARDGDADYSAPYAVPLTADTQLLIFDSSKTAGVAFSSTDAAFQKYSAQLQAVGQLAQQKPNSFFMSHHPLLSVALVKEGKKPKPGGNEGLQSVFSARFPQRLFPDGISLALHGHVHVFESISFKGAQPASLVLGNSGSANEGKPPQVLPPGFQAWAGAEVEDYAARGDYGFATLDRVGHSADWLLTEYTVSGVAVLECAIASGKSRCKKLSP